MSRLSIEIPDTVHQQLKATASLRGMSLRDYVLQQLDVSGEPEALPESEATGRNAPYGGEQPARDSMLELVRNRPWNGTMTKAEIDAYIAEERASWNDD